MRTIFLALLSLAGLVGLEAQLAPAPDPALQAFNWTDSVAYTYDGAGNIKRIGTDVQVYDAVGRLIRSDTNGTRRNYRYDAFGNRLACTDANGSDCQYGRQVTSTRNQLSAATYDPAGNLTNFDGHTYAYDAFNMQTRDQVDGTPVVREYIYTANDERIAVYVPGAGSWQWSLRDASGKVLREMTSSDPPSGTVGTAAWSWVKDYVYREGLLVASRQLEPGAATPTTYHYHLDHLGTPRQITDDSGRIVGAHSYHAFGPELSDGRKDEPSPTRLKYTGHERDPELDYMHARYYDRKMGRFLSVDPAMDVKAAAAAPQLWNRYAYVRNNPINKVDPTGRYEEDVHHQLTYALSRAAGFSPSQAGAIAGADQGVDDNPRTSPFANTEVRAAYHFTTPERRAEMWGAFEKAGSLAALGQFFHAQQDSYSHAGFGARFGHAGKGHAPDKTYNDPAKAMRMAADTYSRLNQAADKLGIPRSDRVAWGQIKSAVVAFNLAKTEKDKNTAIQQLIGAVASARQ